MTRRAFTLLEVTVAIAAASIVTAAAITAIGLLVGGDRQVRQGLAEARTLDRLAQQFRDDVHAASSAQPSAEGQPTHIVFQGLQPYGSVVEYHVEGATATRVEKLNGQIRRQEAFELGDERAIRFDTAGDPTRIVSLVIETSTAVTRGKSSQAWHIEATLGIP